MVPPFWPRVSPHFLACRCAVRPHLTAHPSVAVGLSGGADSLALTAALCAEGADVLALCIDHGLQDGSRDIAEYAAQIARGWGAKARVIPVDVGADSAPGQSLEALARRARYRAFADALSALRGGSPRGAAGGESPRAGSPRGAFSAARVFVAHTADDQAETVLLHLLRGRAAAMETDTVIEGVRVIRPLLSVRRADTEGACAELGIKPWHDPHNDNPEFRRVAIRRDVIGLLEDIVGGQAVPAIAAAGKDLAVDEDFIRAHFPAVERGTLECAEVASLHPALRRRVIANWLLAEGLEVTRGVVGGIGKLCTSYTGQGGVAVRPVAPEPTPAGGRLEVRRVGGKLAVTRANGAH